MNRRQFFGAGAALVGGLWLPTASIAAPAPVSVPQTQFDLTKGSRVLDLYRKDSKERLRIEYLRDGQWVGDAYNQLCWLMRDVRAGEHIAMDRTLIAILDWTQSYLRQFGYTEPIELLSGYRTARTNGRLENAAKRSQHLLGKALDLRIHGLSAEYLGQLYRWLAQGGVGIYDNSQFVHVDTGQIRQWRG